MGNLSPTLAVCRKPPQRPSAYRTAMPAQGPDLRRRSPAVGTERPSLERHVVLIEIGQSALSTIRTRKPSEHVVEGAVLHHQDNDGVKRRGCGRGKWAT